MLSYAAGNLPRAMEQWAAITVEHPLGVQCMQPLAMIMTPRLLTTVV